MNIDDDQQHDESNNIGPCDITLSSNSARSINNSNNSSSQHPLKNIWGVDVGVIWSIENEDDDVKSPLLVREDEEKNGEDRKSYSTNFMVVMLTVWFATLLGVLALVYFLYVERRHRDEHKKNERSLRGSGSANENTDPNVPSWWWMRLCLVNQFVQDHKCVNCPLGMFNSAGDNPWGEDTSCHAPSPGGWGPPTPPSSGNGSPSPPPPPYGGGGGQWEGMPPSPPLPPPSGGGEGAGPPSPPLTRGQAGEAPLTSQPTGTLEGAPPSPPWGSQVTG